MCSVKIRLGSRVLRIW